MRVCAPKISAPALSKQSILEYIPKPLLIRQPYERLTHLHLAMLIKRGKILAMATNREGSRSSGCGYSDFSIHAERAVLKEIDISMVRDSVLIVVRITGRSSSVHLASSKPCEECERILGKFMKNHGLRAVYYS